MAKPLIAIVGRPNVGKSMLFNKLIGKRLSIVEDTPGVTRDRIYGESEWLGRKFRLVDTGGIEPSTDNQILSFMREQAQIAIDNATVIVFVTDIKTGMTAADQEVAGMLQRSKKPIVLAVNKMDATGTVDPDFYEFYNLGLGDPVAVSAVHGHGTGDLLDAVPEVLPTRGGRGRRVRCDSGGHHRQAQRGQVQPDQPHSGRAACHRQQRGGHHPRCHRQLLRERTRANTTSSTPPACGKSPRWTTISKNTASCGPPWPSSAATSASL